MAALSSLSCHVLLLALSFSVLLISPINALNCTSQKFNNNKLYTNCTDLPTLSSYLHYTYNSSNSSLSIAFLAPPAKSDGWVAWGINPNGTGMAGGQALVALKSNGTLVLKTYDLVSYGEIKQSNRSLAVWDQSAEANTTSGYFTIFASVKVPANAAKLNQIWQVGASVTNGVPDKHEFQPANLKAKDILQLVASVPAPSPAPGPAPSTLAPSTPTASTPSSTPSNGTSAGYRKGGLNLGLGFGLFVLVGGSISF